MTYSDSLITIAALYVWRNAPSVSIANAMLLCMRNRSKNAGISDVLDDLVCDSPIDSVPKDDDVRYRSILQSAQRILRQDSDEDDITYGATNWTRVNDKKAKLIIDGFYFS